MLFAKPCRSIVLKIDQSTHDHVFVVFPSLYNFLISNITTLKKEKKKYKKTKHTGSMLRNRKKKSENYQNKKEQLSNKSVKELKVKTPEEFFHSSKV